jgi:NADPH-dependent 2,4-dienoyl-CoA reductase/sulfur reductase-like enzyme
MSETSKRIVIIGLGTGGLHAIRSAQRQDRSVDITVVEKRSYDMFSPCGLPYAVGKRVESFEALKHTIPSTRKLKKLLRHEAKRIDLTNKFVEVENLESGEHLQIPYDSLILATGSKPTSLGIPGASELFGKGVHVVSNPENARALQEHALRSRRAVIVGGGAIGLELASALKSLGLEVIVTKRSLPPFPRNLDPDMGEVVRDFIVSKGCQILFGEDIERINGSVKVESVVIGGKVIETDIVVMAVGVEPEVKLAKEAGIRIEDGAVWTDARMKTSVPDIYAVGECALTFSGIDGSKTKIDLATTAFRQAVVGGTNAAGGDAVFPGALGTFVSFVGELEVSSTGFNSEVAKSKGIRVITGKAKLGGTPSWMPDSKEVTVKIVAEADTGRIIGGQAVGEKGAAWRVNMIALAVRNRVTLRDFSSVELAYCPAVSELYDPLLAAVDVAIQRGSSKGT